MPFEFQGFPSTMTEEAPQKPKTEAQLKKEAAKAAKLAKFEAKKQKQEVDKVKAKDKEPKKDVKKKEVLEYTANTKLGEKKGSRLAVVHIVILVSRRSWRVPQRLQPQVCGDGLVRMVGEGGLLQARVRP